MLMPPAGLVKVTAYHSNPTTGRHISMIPTQCFHVLTATGHMMECVINHPNFNFI